MMKKKKDEDRKPIEQEISELQRKFRVLENDKRAYSEDSQGIIRKQRATIEKLTRENKKMKTEVQESRGSTMAGPEKKIAMETVAHLGDHHEKLQAKMDAELALNKELQEQLDSRTKEVFRIRETMAASGGVNAAMENSKAVQKQIRVLENRLDKSLQTFNQAISDNKVLREQIDLLRRERLVFDDIYRKLENELQQKKKEMANIIEQANAAYEARDSAQAQMAALKQQADKEHAEFEKEWRELGRLIENDKRMKEFMRTKVKEAGAKDAAPKELTSKKSMPLTKSPSDTRKSFAAGLSGNDEKVTSLEEAFSRIQAATGICDIDELVLTFLNGEDQNFGLFKYNNLLRTDIEKLDSNISGLKEEFVTLSGTSNRKEDTERLKILEGLEEKWTDIERKADSFDIKYQEAQQTLTHIRDQIHSIFVKLGCSPEDLPAGCGSGISESSMMQFLALIESRGNDLMKTYEQLQGDDEDFDATKPVRVQGSSANMQIRLPSTVEEYSDDEDDEDEDDQRPFTREELKTKTLKGITKKAKKSRMKGVAQDK